MISLSSPEPILLITAFILTIMATYTSIDLFTLINNSERNSKFLFFGGIASLSIGLWMMDFFMMSSVMENALEFYDFPLAIFSLVITVIFTGIAFYITTSNHNKILYLFVGSLFMTTATISTHIFGVYSMHLNIRYNVLEAVISLCLAYATFFLSFWLMYANKDKSGHLSWIRPMVSFIITIGIGITFYSLTFNSTLYQNKDEVLESSIFGQNLLFYVALFVALVLLIGLMLSNALINKRLEKSDSNLRDIYQALDESSIVAITDPRGKITYANDKFLEISKFSREELIGNDHSILNSGYHSHDFFKNLWRTIGTGKVWKGEIRNKAKDGSIYWVDTTIVPFLNKEGKPYQYVSIRSDITQRKLAEESLDNTLRELSDIKFAIDHASIIAITDQRGRITSVNDKFVEISKYSREELIGQTHSILNSGYHSKEFFKELWRTIGRGQIWKGELRNRAKDGTFYWLDTTIVPFMDEHGKPYQYLAIRTDISERKRTEEYIHRQDKLAVVGQLAAGVAHEIRNPLTSMKGYAEFLTLDEVNEERKEYLEIILDEIERVDSIVEDFMILAKPKADKIETINIVSVMKNVLSLMDYEARKNKVNIHFHHKQENIDAFIDEGRMKQVFLNFIKNAIEAMPNGGDLTVTISVMEKDIRLMFKDTGIGIPPDKLQRLGEPFYTTKAKGNGLGLMTSFQIVESHRGTLRVESEQQKGTTFTLVLPKPENHNK